MIPLTVDAIAILFFLLTSALVYVASRPATYSLLDPVLVLGIAIPFSFLMVFDLYRENQIDKSQLNLFLRVTGGYLLGLFCLGRLIPWRSFRQALTGCVQSFSRQEIKTFLIIAVVVTGMMAYLGLHFGAAGDDRQQFSKLFRPLAIIQSGLYYVSLILLLTTKIPRRQTIAWLGLLTILSIPFSGKSIFFPIIFWVGLLMFLEGRRINALMIISIGMFAISSLIGITMLSYGAANAKEAADIIFFRLAMFGDVYIYAYQQDAINLLSAHYDVPFLSYILHPITSLIGIRAYNKPLGSSLISEFLGTDVFSGPNPQLPFMLDFFFPTQYGAQIVLAVLIGMLIAGFRCIPLLLQHLPSKFLSAGIFAIAVFAPHAGFVDVSLVLISAISIFITAFGAAIISILLRDATSSFVNKIPQK